PSWIEAAPPEQAEKLYEFFVGEARRAGLRVETGSFRKMMEVELVNDGPVTLLLDSRKLF
ncbi:MAG: D-aminoacyl-tRNA deacylase, partial [Acidobacteriota bacterium]|nr:D-aminoacyl-tRNA deacylase [Acidobacteriota bacterium]